MINEYPLYPICDTTMVIDLGLVKMFKTFVNKKKKIFIADKVKQELERKFHNSDKYKFLLDELQNEKVHIINSDVFTEKQLKIMEANLYSYDIRNCIGTKNVGKNFGEFVSSIYAVYLGIKIVKTNDHDFINEYGDEPIFESLKFIDLNETLHNLIADNERIKLMKKITIENDVMVGVLKKEKKQSKDDRMSKLLEDLKKHFE